MVDTSDYLDYLNEDYISSEELERERHAEELAKAKRLKLYEQAKAAKTGTECICPSCAKRFKKKSYQQAFCSNKGANNCKDYFWNRATVGRTHRAIIFTS